MSKKLFLDDVRDPFQVKWVDIGLGPWDIVRSYQEFVEYIEKNGVPSFIAFDHDLSEEHYNSKLDPLQQANTGYTCARWLCDYCIDNNVAFPDYIVHSLNPVGKQNIISLIESYKRVHIK